MHHRLSAQLKLAGTSVSGMVIQKILERNGMGSQYDRLLALEAKLLIWYNENCFRR